MEHCIVLHVLLQEIQRLYYRIHDALIPVRPRPGDRSENIQQKNNIAVLDGVRAIACLIVMSYHISLIGADTHLWDPFSPSYPLFGSVIYAGAMGVTLFFVLSGFLLFMPYAKALLSIKANWPSAGSFYLRRAFRIIPAYYLGTIHTRLAELFFNASSGDVPGSSPRNGRDFVLCSWHVWEISGRFCHRYVDQSPVHLLTT